VTIEAIGFNLRPFHIDACVMLGFIVAMNQKCAELTILNYRSNPLLHEDFFMKKRSLAK
jgi:hypothetical protein